MALKNNIILDLIRLGIKTDVSRRIIYNNLKPIQDWNELRVLAERQGVFAIVLDGLEQLSADLRPPQELLLQWIGEVLQNYEARYDDYRKKNR